MIRIRQWLIILVAGTLVACSGQSIKEKKQVRKEKEAAVINVKLASGYIQRGELKVAEKKLLRAIQLDDEYVPAYTTMAVLMTKVGRKDDAENYYIQAIGLDPHDPELQNNYGAFLCNVGKLEGAFEQFNKALKNQFYATPEIAHANMGYCLMQGDRPNYDVAEKHLRLGLKSNPNMVSALLGMGELGIEMKKYLMARAYMQRYHALVRPSSHSLWIQIQAEHALGDKQYFIKISRELLKNYPSSKEAQRVMRLSDL